MSGRPDEAVRWICTNWRDGRHAGQAARIPVLCPVCGAQCEERTTCGCGHPITECAPERCSHSFARDMMWGNS